MVEIIANPTDQKRIVHDLKGRGLPALDVSQALGAIAAQIRDVNDVIRGELYTATGIVDALESYGRASVGDPDWHKPLTRFRFPAENALFDFFRRRCLAAKRRAYNAQSAGDGQGGAE